MSTSPIPLFGIAYKLTVAFQVGDQTPQEAQRETITSNEWEPEALRITFEVSQLSLSSPWGFADIVIYNLDAPDFQNILAGATWVTLEAGFQTGPTLSSVIWDGPILQVLFDRENVVDQRTTLHCVYNPLAMTEPITFSTGYASSQADLLSKAAAAINLPPISLEAGTLSAYAAQALASKQYPRGNTVFGTIGKHLDIIANDQFLTTTRDGVQAYVTEISKPGAAVLLPSFIYSPPNPPGETLQVPDGTTQTIVGSPRQTQMGIVFTVYLDPRLRFKIPIQVVQLVRVLPSQVAVQPNPSGGNLTTPLTNLSYFVTQVRHIGDSRGNDWYTEVTGYSTTYAEQLTGGIFGSASL